MRSATAPATTSTSTTSPRWWPAASGTLRRLAGIEPAVAPRAGELEAAFAAVPKTRAFRMRARVGERKRWYELPDAAG
jgi:hypothetical protein